MTLNPIIWYAELRYWWRVRRQRRIVADAIPTPKTWLDGKAWPECGYCRHWTAFQYAAGGVCECAKSPDYNEVTCIDDTCDEWERAE